MIKKIKKPIIIFLIGFIIYFVFGMIITYCLNTSDIWNVMFEMDTPRVVGDLSIWDYNHYRVSVHPLFVIIFQPLVLLINILVNQPIITIILLQSIISSITLALFYTTIKKICKNKYLTILMTLLFGMGFPQIVYTTSIETYIFAQFFLILLWLFAINKCDKKFKFCDYFILFLLGIGSIAVTITNFYQFVMILLFVFTLNEKNNHRIFISIFMLLSVIAFSVFIAEIQNIIWPSAPNFFSKLVIDFINGTTEEGYYISKSISTQNFLNVINSNYSYSYNIFSLTIPISSTGIIFEENIISNIFSIGCFISLIILNIIFIKKNIGKIWEHKIYFALIFSYIFNFMLHIFYGNNTAFLYICHYNFIILYLITYLLNNIFDIKKLNNRHVILLSIFIIILFIRTIVIFLNALFLNYEFINGFNMIALIIMIIAVTLLIILIKKNKGEIHDKNLHRFTKN